MGTQPHRNPPDMFQCHKREVEVTTTLHRRELVTFQPHTTTLHKKELATSQPHKKEPDMLHTVARPMVVKLTVDVLTPQPQPTVRRLTLQATEREVTLQLQATVVKLTEVAAILQPQPMERRLTLQVTEREATLQLHLTEEKLTLQPQPTVVKLTEVRVIPQ